MIDAEIACSTEPGETSGALRARVASLIRGELAQEAAAGFPLVRLLPDSETASVPEAFFRLSESDRETLLDALAHYSTVAWSHEVVSEKRANPVLRGWLYRGHKFGPGDPYGRERPRKSVMRKLIVDNLAAAGFTRRKGRPDFLEFDCAPCEFAMKVFFDLDPGLLRQMDYGVKDWMRPELVACLATKDPGAFVPIMLNLSYEHLWDGHGMSGPICWDFMTETTVEACIGLLPEILRRLMALAARINALAVSGSTGPGPIA